MSLESGVAMQCMYDIIQSTHYVAELDVVKHIQEPLDHLVAHASPWLGPPSWELEMSNMCNKGKGATC